MAEGETLTSKGMPKVTEETAKTITDEFTKAPGKWGEHLERVKARMVQEQPHLTKILEGQVGKFPKEMHNALFEISVSTYAILEQQANSNKLSSSFSVGTEGKE